MKLAPIQHKKAGEHSALWPRQRILWLALSGLLLGAMVALAIAGCSKAVKVKAKVTATAKTLAKRATLTPDPLDLNVGIDEAANKNSPVALDVVLIKDRNFWKTAPPMTAKDWFAQKSDLQRRYGNKLQIKSWEWVPSQPIAPITVKVSRFLYGAMVFANYPSPGTHSAPLPLGGKFTISLQKDDFILEKQP
ncbi:MAG: hypothetical protein LAP21_20520 [Acidobacteriia bacterium]|nr:hypothetical protein [Terriglobia bacterium]